MDHNLEDSLNLESTMGVDFGHSEDVVVSEVDMGLEAGGNEEGIPMEYEHIEEQPMLMDTGSEEIIDFMGGQFILQEYQNDQNSAGISVESTQNILTSQSDTMIDLQFEQAVSPTASQDISHPKIISVKGSQVRTIKKEQIALAPMPRQVAIAPKPLKLIQVQKEFIPGKHCAIAPKPITVESSAGSQVPVFTNKGATVRRLSLGGIQAAGQGKTVLAQIGKQLLMVPAGSQKIKLVSTSGNASTVQYLQRPESNQIQLTSVKTGTSASPTKQVVSKIVMQNPQSTDNSGHSVVITKMMPTSTAQSPQTRFIPVQQKGISLGNKVIMASPTKLGVRFSKKQPVISIKSPTQKTAPTQPQVSGTTTKKVVIKSNQTQNVILKTTAPPKTLQVTKDGSIVNVQVQRSQLHQINVPGKGIQYIRLITNSTVPTKPKPSPGPIKTFVLTEEGNFVQMTPENVSGQPPPLVLSANASAAKVVAKPLQKLVRIAPLGTKPMQTVLQPTIRSAQSLLAPLSPLSPPPAEEPTLEEDVSDMLTSHVEIAQDMTDVGADEVCEDTVNVKQERLESKSIESLIAETVAEEEKRRNNSIKIEIERDQGNHEEEQSDESEGEGEGEGESKRSRHPLIVIPSTYANNEDPYAHDNYAHNNIYNQEDNSTGNSMLEAEGLNPYKSPQTPQEHSDTDVVSSELALRPRKACNCTKSQCLKLYCDCFANGEFCNQCNCNNCHNNLENEELRQKAIRGCLDRNPNAFRPKIGKSKNGGPEIIRRHNKGCNCKRSGCLKNYCECFEAKIACTAICKCVGCRNVEETLERGRRRDAHHGHGHSHSDARFRHPPVSTLKQPCSFMTTEVIEAVCQCLVAAAAESGAHEASEAAEPVRDVLDEFARCLQEIIGTAHHSSPLALLEEGPV